MIHDGSLALLQYIPGKSDANRIHPQTLNDAFSRVG